jgi:hypothetical protein
MQFRENRSAGSKIQIDTRTNTHERYGDFIANFSYFKER